MCLDFFPVSTLTRAADQGTSRVELLSDRRGIQVSPPEQLVGTLGCWSAASSPSVGSLAAQDGGILIISVAALCRLRRALRGGQPGSPAAPWPVVSQSDPNQA